MNAYELATREIGTVEWAKGSNPKVVAYYRDAGFPDVKDDAVAWCAAFVGAMLARSGVKPSGALTARSYLKWGVPVDVQDWRQGDIGVIPRGNSTWQGHVFFIDRIEGGRVYALGGNQRDAVNITSYPVSALLGIRRAAKGAVGKHRITTTPVGVTKPPRGSHQTPDTTGVVSQEPPKPQHKGFWALFLEWLATFRT
jgi:uncharacterized protein (TIGR02594 family)